jgi:hypothetical protein
VDCPSCGNPNPGTARFCGSCGAPIAGPTRCRACGAAHSPGQQFCHQCGAQLPDTESPAPTRLPEGERKQVTVLFVDIVGSMRLAAAMDTEEWSALLERFFAIVRESVNRFDGRIDKFTGDGAMALFGAPVAWEDHAQRGCAAALRLRDELADYGRRIEEERGLRFLVRIGLNSGEVVAGAVGQDLSVEYTAVGNTVGAEALGIRSLLPEIHLERAQLARATGDAAGHELENAHRAASLRRDGRAGPGPGRPSAGLSRLRLPAPVTRSPLRCRVAAVPALPPDRRQ